MKYLIEYCRECGSNRFFVPCKREMEASVKLLIKRGDCDSITVTPFDNGEEGIPNTVYRR